MENVRTHSRFFSRACYEKDFYSVRNQWQKRCESIFWLRLTYSSFHNVGRHIYLGSNTSSMAQNFIDSATLGRSTTPTFFFWHQLQTRQKLIILSLVSLKLRQCFLLKLWPLGKDATLHSLHSAMIEWHHRSHYKCSMVIRITGNDRNWPVVRSVFWDT